MYRHILPFVTVLAYSHSWEGFYIAGGGGGEPVEFGQGVSLIGVFVDQWGGVTT